MICPCCGENTFNQRAADMLWSYKDFIVFISKFFTDDYERIKKYDLDYYFNKVKFTCKDLDTWDKILDKMNFYILNDVGSNGKFPPKMAAVVKQDITTAAYQLVINNKAWIQSFNKRDVDELVPMIKAKFDSMTEWNDAKFEFYVEKALQYYKLAD